MYTLDSTYSKCIYNIYHIFYRICVYTYSLLYKACFSIGKCSSISPLQNIE